MIDAGRDFELIVTQLVAVSKALDRACFAVIAAGLPGVPPAEGDRVDTSALEGSRLKTDDAHRT